MVAMSGEIFTSSTSRSSSVAETGVMGSYLGGQRQKKGKTSSSMMTEAIKCMM